MVKAIMRDRGAVAARETIRVIIAVTAATTCAAPTVMMRIIRAPFTPDALLAQAQFRGKRSRRAARGKAVMTRITMLMANAELRAARTIQQRYRAHRDVLNPGHAAKRIQVPLPPLLPPPPSLPALRI